MATNLIFYDSSLADSVVLMSEYYYKNYMAGNTLTVKDVNGLSNSTLGTYIGNLVDATYTEIFIASACEATADTTATDTLNLANQYSLIAKLIADSQGTLSDVYENADVVSATTIGLTTNTWTVNEHVGTPDSPKYVVITGGTGASQLSTIKSNTATTITIYGTFYAVPSSDSDFKILTGSKLFVVGTAQAQSATVTKKRAELGWEAMYPDLTIPLVNYYFAGVPGYAAFEGVSDSFGAATLVDSALGASTNQWAGYFVVVYDATAYHWQYGEILSNNSTTLTLTANWGDGTPTGTPTYRIFAREEDCLKDVYLLCYIMTNMKNITSSSTTLANWTKLIDLNGALANGTAYTKTLQDLDYLNNTVLADGAKYVDWINGEASVAVP